MVLKLSLEPASFKRELDRVQFRKPKLIMRRNLPPLNALKAFEAAARELSISKAAAELSVTPAAVSHQVKLLEETLNTRLFRRMNRALQLTPAGAAILPKLREGFDCIQQAMDRLRTLDHMGTLTLCVAPTFASKWLVPRLHNFQIDHPDIDLRIAASMSVIDTSHAAGMSRADFDSEQIDVAVRFGTGNYPELWVERLLSVSVLAVCSPALLKADPPLTDPASLRFHTLLHDDTEFYGDARPTWDRWLEIMGITGVDARRGPRFNNGLMALEAAAEGQGVLLTFSALAESELALGRLVSPFKSRIPVDLAFYVVSPRASTHSPKVIALRRWLLSEGDRRPPPAGAR